MTELDGTIKRVVRFAPTRFQAPKDYVVELSKEGVTFREKGKRTTVGPVPLAVILAKAETYGVAAVGGGS